MWNLLILLQNIPECADPPTEQDVFPEAIDVPTEGEENAGFIDPPADHVPAVGADSEIGVGEAVERLHVQPQFGAEISVEAHQSRSSSSDFAVVKTDKCAFISEEIRSVVESLNVLLKKGLGEVDAKYPVALQDLVEDCYPRVYGHLFPMRLLSIELRFGEL